MSTDTQRSIYTLARMAESSDPDSDTSAGAVFLRRVEDDAEERRGEIAEGGDLSDLAHEIADSAVPVYTHERWKAFVDLAAYEQDISDLTGGDEDMTTLAGFALYQVARSLVWSLLDGDSAL